MRFSKGNLNNVNKKLLAGSLVLIMLGSSFTGCSDKEINTFEYTINEQGQYEATGIIDYSELVNYCFLVIENCDYNTLEYYISKETSHYARYVGSWHTYRNLFTDQEVFNDNETDSTRKILYCEKLENYLYATNNVKANYAKEEVEQIFEEMKEFYLKENNKQLVKEK